MFSFRGLKSVAALDMPMYLFKQERHRSNILSRFLGAYRDAHPVA